MSLPPSFLLNYSTTLGSSGVVRPALGTLASLVWLCLFPCVSVSNKPDSFVNMKNLVVILPLLLLASPSPSGSSPPPPQPQSKVKPGKGQFFYHKKVEVNLNIFRKMI